AGVDFFEDDASRARLQAALRAPALTALPDGTFPARKDSRFGVSLAQPMYLELWEAGITGLLSQGEDGAAAELGGWLEHLYRLPAPPAETFDAWLQEAGEGTPDHRGRADLGWWMLCGMTPALPGTEAVWHPDSALLEEQGLAVLRGDGCYVSLECGAYGGGHGHPDRLHLTLFTDGVHWLADPGTGSYVARDLFWYRSTLAHNAPRLDGVSQPEGDARCEAFDSQDDWGWARGRWDRFTRTVVAGPDHLVDVLEFADDQEHQVELPLHPLGEITMLTEGRWEPAGPGGEFLSAVERFVPAGSDPLRWEAVLPDGRRLRGICDPGGELWRATGPSRPGQEERPFLLRRLSGRYVRATCVMAWSGSPLVGVEFAPEQILVRTEAGTVTHHQISDGWEIQDGDRQVTLRGGRRAGLAGNLEFPDVGREMYKFTPPVATAFHLAEPPRDGAGFTTREPIHLDHEDQYRRSEEPYGGPDAFSAEASLGWDERALYVCVAVRHDDPVFRPSGAPPLRLDNEPDLIHADGVELFLALGDHPLHGWLVVPDPGSSGLQVHPIAGTAARVEQLRGGWARTPEGYSITVAVSIPDWPPVRGDAAPAFDLMVNQMRSGRLRRLGQLVWTGGGGWVYLRGDRHDPERFGRLDLV
ncbi:MAG TPA: heparinase II/III family protein, partial [Gemmatimonadales bacterium]|nr:heparinase II/III family protein [Gemmatimonadales bacterium]